MAKLKRLATKKDQLVVVERPLSDSEINSREVDYPLLTPIDFAKKYRNVLFRPTTITFNGVTHEIQYNACTDPFCKWYGMNQHRFEEAKHKPYRYKMFGSAKHRSQTFICNPDPINPTKGMTWNCVTVPFSNWSIAEEISRLATLDKVVNWEPDYRFHREGCVNTYHTPFNGQHHFYRRGKSSSNSQKWQCKECKKITNVLPTKEKSFGYHQQRNDILHSFALALINRTPVKRTCEILEIGSETYYQKLEWMYKCCLEFLGRHESKALSNKTFDQMWLNTDKMIYFLNNVRRKGQGGRRYDNLEDKTFPTHIVVTSDVHSRYVFRSDVAYDFEVDLKEVEQDTILYKEDHLNDFARKNARLRFSYAPQPPSANDTQTNSEYLSELNEFTRRGKYIDGLHVNSTYTTIAHLWHIKQMVKAKEWRFVTDEDSTIMTALFRVFKREVKLGQAHHFLSMIDRSKSLKDAYNEFLEAKEDLIAWGDFHGHDTKSLRKLAYLKLQEIFKKHSFHEVVNIGGKGYLKWVKSPIEHPLASPDKGRRFVDCTTDLSAYDPKDIANLILEVNGNAADAFMQQIRRRISILERPLVTARGDGKSYIYANFNPKYAQYALTILRTYYNFCVPFKTRKLNATPAQRLGITDKEYTLKDIIYLK